MKVHLALFAVALIYGANYSIAKTVMPPLDPFGIIFCRVLGAGILFWVLHALSDKQKISQAKDYAYLALCGFFGVAANQMLFFKGLSMTDPINAAVIMTISPILVLVTSAILIKEKLTFQKGLGSIIGGIGAILLIGGVSFQFSSDTAMGDLCILFNATSYAIYLVIVKPMMKKYSSLTVVKWIFSFGFLMILPFCWPEFNAIQWQDLDAKTIQGLAFIVLGTTFLAYLLNAWALQYVNPSIVGIYIYLQPIIATCFSVYMKQGELTQEKVMFTLIIFSGVYLVIKPNKKVTA